MKYFRPQIVLGTRPCLSSISSRRVLQQQTRQFHQTKPSQFISEVLDLSAGLLHGVHSITGLPWVASIPLTAFIVRMVVAMPLQIYSRIHARRERDLSPLLLSWRKHLQDRIMKEYKEKGERLLPHEADRLLKKELAQRRKLLLKRWNVSRFYKPAGFLQIPVWLSLMESLRAMCGNDQGLVPYLLSLIERISATPENALHVTVEPSLASEGALWFPDLLAGDPTGVLPAILCLSILLNIRLGWKAPTFKEISDLPDLEFKKQVTLRLFRILIQIMAVNVGVASYVYGMPTGLMIYWITSSNVATLQTFLLDKYMFAKPPLKPWLKMHIGVLKPGDVIMLTPKK
ncbi:putative mitochondrial export translocase Oxa2 [Thermoascus aurantiacus ATCC 26904]